MLKALFFCPWNVASLEICMLAAAGIQWNMHVLSMVHFMSRHQDGPVLLQKHVHDSQLYLWQHFRTQRHGSGQIRIIRTSSPRRQFACVTFHLAWLILLLGITGLVPLPTKSQWRSSFCGHAKCEKTTFTRSKVYSPVDLIEALQLRPSNQKKLSASEKSFFVHRPLKK